MTSFYKYHGAGNDFILFDARKRFPFEADNHQLINKLCDRRFGIGADGLMLLSEHPDFDFEMLYFNADGHPSTMCGNGGRCIAAFAHRLGIVRDEYRFLAVDGPHAAVLKANGIVALEMSDVTGLQLVGNDYELDTGSPHYVRFVADTDQVDIVESGRKIRNGPTYVAAGINVNFVTEQPDGLLKIRTYERGVEDETLACGTGVTAAALAAVYREKHPPGSSFVKSLQARGGALSVSGIVNEDAFQSIWLTGPTKFVYSGTIGLLAFGLE